MLKIYYADHDGFRTNTKCSYMTDNKKRTRTKRTTSHHLSGSRRDERQRGWMGFQVVYTRHTILSIHQRKYHQLYHQGRTVKDGRDQEVHQQCIPRRTVENHRHRHRQDTSGNVQIWRRWKQKLCENDCHTEVEGVF